MNGIELATEKLIPRNASATVNEKEADLKILTQKNATKAAMSGPTVMKIPAADEPVLTQPITPIHHEKTVREDDIDQRKATEIKEEWPLRGTKVAKGMLKIKVPEEEAKEQHIEEIEEVEMLMAAEGVHPTALLYVPVELREKVVWSLVDSGAADNFISVKTVQRLQLPTQRLEEPMVVCVGNGQLIQATEYVYRTLHLGEYKAKTKLKVLPTPIHMVLGYPFLAKHQPKIEWAKRRLFFIPEGQSLLG